MERRHLDDTANLGSAVGRRWRRRLSVLSPTTLRWFVGLFSAFVGALLLVVPHLFEEFYWWLIVDVRIWGVVFLVTGLGLVLVLSSRLPRRWVLVAHVPVALAFLALALAFLPSGLWTGSVTMLFIAVGMTWAGFLPLQRRLGSPRGDLFSLLMGFVGIANGIVVVISRWGGEWGGQDTGLDSTVLGAWLLGLLWFTTSVLLVRVQMRVQVSARERILTHLAAGGTFLWVGLMVALPGHAWFGVVIYGGAGLVLLVLPSLRQKLQDFDPLSLRIRLAIVPAIAAMASLTITVALVTQQQELLAESQARQTLREQADAVALNVADFIDLKAADVVDLTREVAPRMYLEEQRRAVIDACQRDNDFLGCVLLNTQAQEIDRAGDMPTSNLQTEYDEIVQAHRQSSGWVELKLATTSDATIPLLGAPIYNPRGQFLGTLVAALGPTSLDRRIGRSGASVDLSDGHGVPIARRLPLSPESDGTRDGSTDEASRRNRVLRETATVSENLGWLVEVRQPRSAALAGILRGRETAFLLLLVMVALAAWGGIWAALTITRPVGALASAVDDLEVDRLDATWHPAAEGQVSEIDRLSGAFDQLRERLAQQTRERDQLALELQARADMLSEQDRRKDEFLAMLAHELRNPLGAMSSAVFLLRESEGTPEERKRRLGTIDRQIHHLARMVDDLLDVSRITRGKVELRRELRDLVPLVRDVTADFGSAVDAKQHRLVLTVPDEPVWTEVDATRFGQILGNLVSNAVKYSDPGGEIRIRLRNEGNQAVLTVEDDGRGLEPELLPHVFDLFTQGHQGLDRSDSGLGIGLTLVRQLARMHEGSVEADSAGPGRGSQFTVRIPLAEPPARTDGSEAKSASSDVQRILVVDDHQDAAEALAEILRHRGHEVAVTHDGPGALREAAAFRPDTVLVDIGLPGMDGYQVARELRRDGASRLLVAVTGYGRNQDRRRALEAGFDHFLTKPLEIEELGRLLADG